MSTQHRVFEHTELWISDEEIAAVQSILDHLDSLPNGIGLGFKINGRNCVVFLSKLKSNSCPMTNLSVIPLSMANRILSLEDSYELLDFVSECESHPDFVLAAQNIDLLPKVEIKFWNLFIEMLERAQEPSF